MADGNSSSLAAGLAPLPLLPIFFFPFAMKFCLITFVVTILVVNVLGGPPHNNPQAGCDQPGCVGDLFGPEEHKEWHDHMSLS